MTKIILNGYFGKMGQVICRLAEKHPDFEIVAGIDVSNSQAAVPFPVYASISECNTSAHVVVDFSVSSAVSECVDYCVSRKLPCVVCTTGLSEKMEEKIQKASEHIAVLRSANMSMGVNLIANIAKQVSRLLYDSGFDIEILEKHHNQKVDAPSGTALLLGNAVKASLNEDISYSYDRTVRQEKRPKAEIGFSVVRGGTIVGEHSIIYAGNHEVIEFSHSAQSKEVFAVGALKAAEFLKDKTPGFYTMDSLFIKGDTK